MKIGILAFFAIGGKCHRNTQRPLISNVLALIFIANLTLPWTQTKVFAQNIQTLRIGENIVCQTITAHVVGSRNTKYTNVKAVGKGSCIVYVYARNGYAKKVQVQVE